MALLIDVNMPEWMSDEDLRRDVLSILPGTDVRLYENMGDPSEIEMAAVTRLRPDLAAQLPNLKLVQKLGAGVETMVGNPDLPAHVRITRLKPDAPAREIAEFCLAYILREQRNMQFHDRRQTECAWDPIPPRITPQSVVGVLGLGHIGSRTANMIAGVGFKVIGYSRSPKYTEGIDCRHGADALLPMLAECDYVASVLPSTPETRGLVNREFLASMKEGSVLINVGRGDLVIEKDLLNSLNADHLGHAVLDVVSTEPLPEDDPLWTHPKVTVTPHVSGWHLGDALKDVAENYRRLQDGTPLLHEVNRARGY
ncbi:MAG: glyoxylate/hydroxypyruvate reductase A [Alphaproteobacteria bacterium]|nr:glyoxylate/hydroxypyruvate reductase A [Alphaproteobacteria bacterium]